MSSLGKYFLVAFQEAIVKLGFKKHEKSIFLLPINDEIAGWIGLNRSTQHGVISLNPVIGIAHFKVKDIKDRLSGKDKKNSKYVYPIVTTPLEYLPDCHYNPKCIETLEDIPREVNRIIDFVQSCAIPFIKKNSDLKSILELMLQHYGHPHQTIYYIPISYHLLGMAEQALAYAEKTVKEMEGDIYQAAENYRKFYKNFLIYIKEGKLPDLL